MCDKCDRIDFLERVIVAQANELQELKDEISTLMALEGDEVSTKAVPARLDSLPNNVVKLQPKLDNVVKSAAMDNYGDGDIGVLEVLPILAGTYPQFTVNTCLIMDGLKRPSWISEREHEESCLNMVRDVLQRNGVDPSTFQLIRVVTSVH